MGAVERERTRRVSWAAVPRITLAQVVEALPVAAAAFTLVGFVLAAYFRVTFPYPMWVMETPTIQAMRRIASGQLLYAPPSLDYVAPIYAPLYFYVATLAAHLVGVNLTAARLVSLAASIGCAGLVGYLVWSQTRRGLVAIVCAGLFVATTALSSLSLDLARVDPLCLLLLLGAVATARGAQRSPRYALWLMISSGVLTALAGLTKQTALVMAAPLLLSAILDRRWRCALAYLAAFGVVTVASGLLLYLAYGRWAPYFLVLLPSRHNLALAPIGFFWSQQMLPAGTLLLLLAPLFFIGRALRADWQAVRFWVLTGAAMLGMSWLATLNQWSDSNVLLPAFAALTILAGLGFDELLVRVGDARPFRVYAFALLAIEFAIVAYNPRETSPLRSDVWGADRLVSTLASMPGTVFAPDLSEYVYQAGKGDNAFGIGVLELTGGFGGTLLPEGSAWVAAYRAALDQRRYDVLLLDPESVEPFLTDAATSSGYVDTGPLFQSDDVFWLWGPRYVPRFHVWVPKERAHQGS